MAEQMAGGAGSNEPEHRCSSRHEDRSAKRSSRVKFEVSMTTLSHSEPFVSDSWLGLGFVSGRQSALDMYIIMRVRCRKSEEGHESTTTKGGGGRKVTGSARDQKKDRTEEVSVGKLGVEFFICEIGGTSKYLAHGGARRGEGLILQAGFSQAEGWRMPASENNV
ncbi:hypothetical protein B0H10DRAFT_1943603 [Mycena sp. CBHHK59/15]|nr:hypothetical protein B0H10DRAFT_1947614 [Mycena sp. CBHHK59/15]KAJ6623817.1 hypothetical protein B0H10DRAFT_1943603 [Mycena sp. CBHHK59/15]